MALKAEIQTVVSALTGAPSFIYGTELEINVKADDVANDNGYVFMFSLQSVKASFTVTNAISNSYDIFMAFIYKIEFDSTDSEQCEPYDTLVIDRINEFLIRLKGLRGTNGGKVFDINIDDTVMAPAAFNYMDTNFYGRTLTMKLKSVYNKKLCLPGTMFIPEA